MKKIKNLSESSFLKLFFVFVTAAFLIGAVCMPDRGDMFAGFVRILTSPAKVSTNYFSVGGFAGTLLNMGLVAAAMTALFHFSGTKVNNVSTLAFLLTLGFCSWGIHLLNMWFTMAGVAVGCLIKKEKPFSNINAMLFTTGVAPFISELLVRYPHAEAIGFNVLGFVLAVVVGLAVGIMVPAGLPHSPNVHKGMNLYSAALPVGMVASKIGRKKTILIGIVMLFTAFFVGCFLTASSPNWLMTCMFCLAGVAWATINVNSFPMVVEMCSGADVGKYTGFYYTASMAAQSLTPTVSGIFMDKIAMTSLFPYASIFVGLAFFTMLMVKHGDSKVIAKKGLEAFDNDD